MDTAKGYLKLSIGRWTCARVVGEILDYLARHDGYIDTPKQGDDGPMNRSFMKAVFQAESDSASICDVGISFTRQ